MFSPLSPPAPIVWHLAAGYLEAEFRALGVPFAGRGRRTDEYVGAMRALWDGDHASYDGETVSLTSPLEFAVVPRGLRLLVPRGTRVGLDAVPAGHGEHHAG